MKHLLHPATRPFWLIIVLLVLWDIAIRVFKIPPYLVPPPLAVVKQLGAEWPMLLREMLPTLYATLGGFVLSAVIGVPIGRASCREECLSQCRSRWSPYH